MAKRYLGGGMLEPIIAAGDKRLYRETRYPDKDTEIKKLKWIKLGDY